MFPQVYDDRKLACHYVHSREFIFDIIALIPLDLLQLKMGTHPLLRFTRFFKVSVLIDNAIGMVFFNIFIFSI